MNDDRDLDRLLDTWIADGPSMAPDRVVDGVASRITRQRQIPAWRLRSWRFPSMSTPLKLVAIGAALLAVLVGGAVFMGVGSAPPAPPPTAAPTATATPTPTLSPTPSPRAVFPPWIPDEGSGAGILTAGSQSTRFFVPGFTFTVPEGWVNGTDDADYYHMFPDTPANQAAFAESGDIAQGILMGPHESPYFVCDAWEDNRGTAAEMVTAMVANEALATSGVVDVTIGGLTGKQFDVRLDPGWTETCPGDPPELDLGDMRTRGFLLDTPDRGVIVIFVGSPHSAGHEAFVAEAMPIIESFTFDTGQ